MLVKGVESIRVEVETEEGTTAELSIMLIEGKQPTQAEGVADAVGFGTGNTLDRLDGAGHMVRVNGAVRAAELESIIVGIGIGEKLIVAFLLSVEKGGAGISVLGTLATEVVAASVVRRAGVVNQLKLVSESVDADSVVAESIVVGTAEISELELGLWLTMIVLVTCVVE